MSHVGLIRLSCAAVKNLSGVVVVSRIVWSHVVDSVLCSLCPIGVCCAFRESVSNAVVVVEWGTFWESTTSGNVVKL